MNIKKILAAAAVMAAGVCAGVPAGTETTSPLAITAEAASKDFVIKTNDEGEKYLAEYKGKGGNVTIPKEVTLIYPAVFAGNDDITSVTVKGSNVWVSPDAFMECTNLKKVVFEGDATICQCAFDWCINLESVTVKGSIDGGIYANAFYGCESLKTVKISGNKKAFVIGGGAFRDCFSLTSINIPSKCTEIYGCAFLNCFSLTKLTIPAKTKINTDDGGDCHFGYAHLYKSPEDAEKAVNYSLYGEEYKSETFVANGKKSGYAICLIMPEENKNKKTGGSMSIGNYSFDLELVYESGTYTLLNAKKVTPKQLTLTVTKGSPAEKWAKANKVKYVYAKTTKTTTTKK